MRLPELQTRTLQGQDKSLPADLPAERTLVVIAFQQRHQSDVDAWMAVAADRGWLTDLSSGPSQTTDDVVPRFAVIEIPCITRRWGPVRRFIDGGMATTIAVPEVLARTWTAYTDVGKVQRALEIPDSSEIWVGVVDRDGNVRDHVDGLPTDSTIPVITSAMAPPGD